MRKTVVMLLIASLLAAFAGPGLWLHQRLEHQHATSTHHPHQSLQVHQSLHQKHCLPHHDLSPLSCGDAPDNSSPAPHEPVDSEHDCAVCHLLLVVGPGTPAVAEIAVAFIEPAAMLPVFEQLAAHLTSLTIVGGRDPPPLLEHVV